MSDSTNLWFGEYQVLRELGRGAMGVVYACRGPAGEQVAIKLLLDPSASQEDLSRFAGEAAACQRIAHPGIVGVHGAGVQRGMPYLVMDCLEGISLEDRLSREGPFPQVDLVAIGAEVAEALAHLHAAGIVHRDLKPANVMLVDGHPVIADFGLARDAARERERLTQTGQILGTPSYMSPEQANGRKDVGPPTDVYALGGVLYTLLTGGPPFVGAPLSVMRQVLEDKPPLPHRLRTDIDRGLEAICLRCLAKDPQARPSADELAALLRSWRPGIRGLPLLGAAALATAALGVGCVGLALWLATDSGTTPPAPPPEPAVARPPDPTPEPEPEPEPGPDLAETLARVATLRQERRWVDAHAELDAVAEASEGRAEYWVARGYLYRWRNTYEGGPRDEAIAAFRRALELDPNSADAHALLLLSVDHLPDAADHARRALDLGRNSSSLAWIAHCRQLTLATRSVPRSAASERYVELVRERHEATERARAIEPDSVWALEQALAIGFELARLDPLQEQEAFQACVAAIRRHPSEPLFHHLLGGYIKSRAEQSRDPRERRGLFERAVDEFDKAIAKHKNYVYSLIERGYTVGCFLAQVDAGVADLQRAAALEPTNPHIPFVIGVVCHVARRWEEAAAGYVRASVLNPGNPEYPLRLGRLRLDTEDPQGALAAFEQSLALCSAGDPRRAELEGAIARLRAR